jgi:hypothetical protein
MGDVCRKLDFIAGYGIWFDTLTVQNWLVKNIVAIVNSDQVLCRVFWLYSSFVPGILKHV